ncbi:unnamed protein product [Adineta steineri]|uniref:PLAT domain-containing protein n=1 Tax=Adineta steineri TaxID=433720 RepID=A0A818JJ32_9BILA|nr:unnamed protein product [Adineta steineri]CAF3539349.1 unnamed protein product [Adineta steineri]
MTHPEPSTLAQYNSLTDPNLQSYFSNERMQTHLKHAGLISGRGDVLSDSEYRTRLARREHKKHVRHMLAENIVNRAIDMERSRNAERNRYFDMVAKAALVNDIKESRKRTGHLSGLMSCSSDMALLSVNSSWSQARPRSANYQNDMYEEQISIPRIQSASMNGDHRPKSSSKTRNRRQTSLQRPKSLNRPRSPAKYPKGSLSSSPCQIKMVYYGPHTKIDYDRMIFTDIDEVIVMQQHCGGENLPVCKKYLKPGDEFTFISRRHSDYPFGLSLYIKGLIDSRISTCCEYKHRHGVRLGGERGHFAIISVDGSKPCIKCQFEKQARLKKYAQSPKGRDQNGEPVIVSMSVSDEPKTKQKPVLIPVRHTSISNEDSYEDDFDGSENRKQLDKDDNSSDSTRKSLPNDRKPSRTNIATPKVPPRVSRVAQKASSERSDTSFDETPKEKSTKKTWQIIFHPTNISKGNFQIGKNHSSKRFLLKFSFSNKKNETESYEIDMKPFIENSKSARPYTLPVKLENIGKPKHIRLRMITTQTEDDDDDDEEEEDDIKWHLDHIEAIDPETQTHFIFPCKRWITPFKENSLRLSQELSRDEKEQKASSNTNDSRPLSSHHKNRQQSAKIEQKPKVSSRSSTPTESPKPKQTKSKPTRFMSSDDDDDNKTPKHEQKVKTSARSSASSNSSKPLQTKSKPTRLMSSDDDDDHASPKPEQKAKASARSSASSNSSKPLQTKSKLSRQTDSDDDDDDKQKSHKSKQKSKAPSGSSTPTETSKPTQTKSKPTRSMSSDEDDHASSKPKQKAKTPSGSSTPAESPKPKPTQTKSKSSHQTSSDDDNEASPKLKQKAKESSRSSTPTQSSKPPQTKSKHSRQKSSDDDNHASPKSEQKPKASARSSISSNTSKQSQSKVDSIRRISSDQQENKIRYRVTIYPSHDDDGEFNPARSSRIFLRLNNHPEENDIQKRTDHLCPTFVSGVDQPFELDLVQNADEQIKTLTIGYVNSEIQAKTWKLEKIVLYNMKTHKETTFLCKESLHRNDLTWRAEKTFEAQTQESDGETTPRNHSTKSDDDEEQIKSRKNSQTNRSNKQRSPSFQSMDDNDAHYDKIFQVLDPNNKLELGSRPPSAGAPRPKTRRGREEYTDQPVDPLVGLDALGEQTARSTDRPNENSHKPVSTNNRFDN